MGIEAKCISSDSVEVFPSTKRWAVQPGSKRISEQNLVGIVNKLLDADSFVITSDYLANGRFDFNIHGYYFSVMDVSKIISVASAGNEIWANIRLKKTGDYTELFGQDTQGQTSVYEGVYFSNSDESKTQDEYERYSLKILTKESGSYKIPDTSKVKYSSERVSGVARKVDGGIL